MGLWKFGTSGIVDKVVVTKNKNNLRIVLFVFVKVKDLNWEINFHPDLGLKGVCGMILEQGDMPFSKDGIVP